MIAFLTLVGAAACWRFFYLAVDFVCNEVIPHLVRKRRMKKYGIKHYKMVERIRRDFTG